MRKILIISIMFIMGACTTPYQVDTEDIVMYEEIYNDYYKADQFEEAIEKFKALIDEYPWSSKVDNSWYYIGRSYEELDDSSNAIDAFEKVPEKSPQYDEAQDHINDLRRG